MGVKVIGAGFGRTGTLSLKASLEELGFDPCYHMEEVFKNPQHIETWAAAANGHPVEWRQFFESYEATVDWPACSFYKELMQEYPEAKVLLSIRDPERWYESAWNTIYTLRRISANSTLGAGVFSVVGLLFPHVKRGSQMVDALIWDGTFDGRFEDRQYATEVFERHNEEVIRSVPEDRLLVYEVKEGWGPLCEFLEVEVPQDKPFPHLNDTARIRRTVFGLAAAVLVPVVLALTALGVLVFRFVSRRRS